MWGYTGKAFLLTAAIALAPAVATHAQAPADTATRPWYFSSLELPARPLPADDKPVLIAVVDDGFNLAHPQLRPFWYQPPGEIPGNGRDDDGNGYADDATGWDVSDKDPDASAPAGRESTFYHGSFICGIIADLLTQSFGPVAPRRFRILPVKALADQAGQTYLRDGYRGVAYALSLRPDIIVCAWNGGSIGAEEEAIFERARRAGVIVIASAGNMSGERSEPPASLGSVIAVAAVDSTLEKSALSSYGMFVDLAGPGQRVRGASASDDGDRYDGGTSAAAAAVVAGLAILREAAPGADPETLLLALKNTAQPLDHLNPRYAGKLGSGFPRIDRALTYLTDARNCCLPHNPALPEGALTERLLPRRAQQAEWQIAPAGAFRGIWFDVLPGSTKGSSSLQFLGEEDTPATEILLVGTPQRVFIPGSRATVRYTSRRAEKNPSFTVYYHVETIDSSSLYCSGMRYYENPSGTIRDGSGNEDYANRCDCKWQIALPPGQRVQLRFSEFDTQARTDFVYLFDGDSPVPSNIIAKFSGSDIPPEVISRTNRVLVWFVTDDSGTGGGWTLHYEGH